MHTFLLAFLASALYGTGLVTTHFGLRHLPALAGARVSIPTAALLFWGLSPVFMDWGHWRGEAVMLFALVGSFYPAAVTLITFVGNRRLGPTVAGTIGTGAGTVVTATSVAGGCSLALYVMFKRRGWL